MKILEDPCASENSSASENHKKQATQASAQAKLKKIFPQTKKTIYNMYRSWLPIKKNL